MVFNRKDALMNETNFICETQSQMEKKIGALCPKIGDGQVLKKMLEWLSAATGEYTDFTEAPCQECLSRHYAHHEKLSHITMK